jgi:hypothetical protein
MLLLVAGSAVLQGGVFGLSGIFPKKYSQSVMGGMVQFVTCVLILLFQILLQGLGGLIAAVANLITVAVGSNPIQSGFGYFVTAEIVVIAALVGFLCLPWIVSRSDLLIIHVRWCTLCTVSTDQVFNLLIIDIKCVFFYVIE